MSIGGGGGNTSETGGALRTRSPSGGSGGGDGMGAGTLWQALSHAHALRRTVQDFRGLTTKWTYD